MNETAQGVLGRMASENNGRVLLSSPIPHKIGAIICPRNRPSQPCRVVQEATLQHWLAGRRRAIELSGGADDGDEYAIASEETSSPNRFFYSVEAD
jgi:hypothetical protein